MPYYEILHSYPLTTSQKSQLANAITHLHSRTFQTPSLFVNVTFTSHDATDASYFVAGKPRQNSTNRILAMVRTSEQRTKAHFDKLAAQLEDAWYDTLLGEVIDDEKSKDKGKRTGEAGDKLTQGNRDAMKLLFVVFHPMITARENGVTIPGAGEEGNWLKENMAYFKEQADTKGDEDFIDLVKEVETRDDLKKLIS